MNGGGGAEVKKVLVTGGAGFIGSHVVDRLLADGCAVTVVDTLALGRTENISHHQANPRFSFYKADASDVRSMERIFSAGRFDAVYHLAANSDIARSHGDPDVDYRNTFLSTFTVLEMMRRANVNSILFASSSAVYGDTSSTLGEEDGPLRPVSHYGAAKLAGEAFISSFAANYGISAWILRFPNVVGARATHGVIYDFVGRLRQNPHELVVLGDGRQNKPYLYVSDLVEAIVCIVSRTSGTVNVFNVGVESRTTVSRIAAIVLDEMNLHATVRYTGGDRGWIGDVPEFTYRLDKIHALGWRASFDSDSAVRKAVKDLLVAS